ncbi:MAG TPA: HopJ type III effector protein [Pseudomonas sabulinigri]|uniref:HopJ type III effector protein n=1 Tax=marine sediment metagenome TaxID=412755 RepID=A0A0F9XA03_9ZZZZ|nr:HopJ type III effector protein [Halopseudomonas sabulinigri]HEC52904.1 HopJ type III effector protein [Halopseudomonas sabulinigri]|tara:strand:- start:845 stop:1177 length:333 start_codon:yes stop_codon:yes gene_type:complete
MTPEQFVARLSMPEHCFADTLSYIAQHYHYQPSAFDNGSLHNSAEQNQGSCKVLAMAQDLQLTDQQTLACFAEHYQAVLSDPEGSDHANIRAIMNTGLSAVSFASPPLKR